MVEIVLTEHQQKLKQAFIGFMIGEDENDKRTVLISLLEDAKKQRKDVTIKAPCARLEIRTTQ